MSLSRNILINLVGHGSPLIAAAICIPILIGEMGTVRFGVLTIAWMVIGYFSLFDLGLGRALTRSVAEKIGSGDAEIIPRLIWTSLVLMALLGMFAGLLIASTTDKMVSQVLSIPSQYQRETRISFWLLAVSVPFVILTTGMRGVMEAYQRFDLTNLVRIPMGIWTFAGPLLVFPWTHQLHWVVAILVAGRLLTTVWHAFLVLRVLPALRANIAVDKSLIRPLLGSGGWMSVSNVISPIMVYMDRFFIGAVIGIGLVAYYTTPYEVVFRLNVIPEAVFGVLFPLMTAQLASSKNSAGDLFSMSVRLMAASMFPAALTIVLLSYDFLLWWVGPEFALRSTSVMQILAVGIFMNCMSKVSYNLIQAEGRADITAKIHLFELPIYIAILMVALHYFGIVGAALAWSVRMTIDFGLLTFAARRVSKIDSKSMRRSLTLIAALVFVLSISTLVPSGTPALWFGSVILATYSFVFYRFVLLQSERVILVAMLRKFLRLRRA